MVLVLPGLNIEQATIGPSTSQNRVDVACFVGFVALSAAVSSVPAERRRARFAELYALLRAQGFVDVPGTDRDPLAAARQAEALELVNVPVPCASWADFETFFDGDRAPVSSEPTHGQRGSYLGAAVRSFFVQGGRRCYVVRAGDPGPFAEDRAARLARVNALIPDFVAPSPASSPNEPQRWRGLSILHALEDVSFVALPDLPHLVSQELVPAAPEEPAVFPNAAFSECAETVAPRPASSPRPPLRAPRCLDESGYRDWARALRAAADFLARHRSDVQLVASVPLPSEQTAIGSDLLLNLLRWGLLARRDSSPVGISSAFVQLSYPWLSWPGSRSLPEALEPPEGAVIGAIARSTLRFGTFRSAARTRLLGVLSVSPELSAAERSRPRPLTSLSEPDLRGLEQRISLVGRSGAHVELLSDVTTSADEAYRAAGVNRLTSVWVRALAQAGRELVFEPSNEVTWERLRQRVRHIGLNLLSEGALRGESAQQAFRVRCDASTTTRDDIDRGRLNAEVEFNPRAPIESILVALNVDESQHVSARSSGGLRT